jgi:hypothetical protein
MFELAGFDITGVGTVSGFVVTIIGSVGSLKLLNAAS